MDYTTDSGDTASFSLGDIPAIFVQLWNAKRVADLQDELFRYNITAANRGQRVLTLNDVGGAAAIQPSVNVGFSEDTKKLLWMGGLGLGALAIFAAMR